MAIMPGLGNFEAWRWHRPRRLAKFCKAADSDTADVPAGTGCPIDRAASANSPENAVNDLMPAVRSARSLDTGSILAVSPASARLASGSSILGSDISLASFGELLAGLRLQQGKCIDSATATRL